MSAKERNKKKCGNSEGDLVKGEGNHWYNTKRLAEAWIYIMKFLDKTFKDCDVLYDGHSRYDLSQHRILVGKSQPCNRLELISMIIEMIIRNLVPGTQRVMYKEKPHLMVSVEGIDHMAGRIAEKIYPGFDRTQTHGWLGYLKRKYTEKKKKEAPKAVNRRDLAYMYYEKQLTCSQIGEVVGAHRTTIEKLMEEYGLPRRKKGQKVYISPERLDDLYYNQDFTIEEIAKILEVDYVTVFNKMEEYGMPRRDKVYTVPAWMNRVKVFKSELRKKFRRNKAYIQIAREVVEDAEKDPDLYEFRKDVSEVEKYRGSFEEDQ